MYWSLHICTDICTGRCIYAQMYVLDILRMCCVLRFLDGTSASVAAAAAAAAGEETLEAVGNRPATPSSSPRSGTVFRRTLRCARHKPFIHTPGLDRPRCTVRLRALEIASSRLRRLRCAWSEVGRVRTDSDLVRCWVKFIAGSRNGSGRV